MLSHQRSPGTPTGEEPPEQQRPSIEKNKSINFLKVYRISLKRNLSLSWAPGHAGFSHHSTWLNSCSSWALEHRLSSCGAGARVFEAGGILPD